MTFRARSVPNIFSNTADDILARSTVETWTIKAEKGAGDCCKKCDGKVFEAEKMVTASVSIVIGVRSILKTKDYKRIYI